MAAAKGQRRGGGHYGARELARVLGLTEGSTRSALHRHRISIDDFDRVVAFILERRDAERRRAAREAARVARLTATSKGATMRATTENDDGR